MSESPQSQDLEALRRGPHRLSFRLAQAARVREAARIRLEQLAAERAALLETDVASETLRLHDALNLAPVATRAEEAAHRADTEIECILEELAGEARDGMSATGRDARRLLLRWWANQHADPERCVPFAA